MKGLFFISLIKNVNRIPKAFLFFYIFAFSIGFGPLPYVVNGEFFPMESKALGASIAAAFDWFCTFLLAKVLFIFAD